MSSSRWGTSEPRSSALTAVRKQERLTNIRAGTRLVRLNFSSWLAGNPQLRRMWFQGLDDELQVLIEIHA